MSEETKTENPEKIGFNLPKEAVWMTFCGRQRSGKSYAIRHIIQETMKSDDPYEFGIVFVKTKFNGDYNYIDDKYVRDDFTVQALHRHIKNMEDWTKTHNNQMQGKNFIILDDLQGLRDPNDPLMKSIVSTFRHTNTHFFISAQYLNVGTSTSERECSNYAFMFNTGSQRTMKSWYQYFGQVCDSEKEFIAVLKDVTSDAENHEALLFVQGAPTKRESYFSWKAGENDDDFKVVFARDRKEEKKQQ